MLPRRSAGSRGRPANALGKPSEASRELVVGLAAQTVPPPIDVSPRGRRLRAALAAVLVADNAPELRLARERLNNWAGIGLIIAGITHQGWDVQLTAYAARDWRANFFPVGIAHSIVGGSAWESTVWRAV